MAGLVARAARCTTSPAGDIDVVVVDKGRSPGGRMATRRIGAATFDHGAQFFTVRTPAFRRRVDDWIDRGLVTVWNHGFDHDDGYPRYVAPRRHDVAGEGPGRRTAASSARRWRSRCGGRPRRRDPLGRRDRRRHRAAGRPRDHHDAAGAGVRPARRRRPRTRRATRSGSTTTAPSACWPCSTGPCVVSPAAGCNRSTRCSASSATTCRRASAPCRPITFHANPAWSEAALGRRRRVLGAGAVRSPRDRGSATPRSSSTR